MNVDNTLQPRQTLRVAVLLPCYNEEAAIGATVAAFRAALPDAVVYVYDNNSKDRTIEVAAAAGAVVGSERLQGKAAVVRRMFADIDADVYVLADGDLTYEAAAAPRMIAMLLADQLDMVTGARIDAPDAAYRRGHVLGNRMLTLVLTRMFGRSFSDMMTGYRVLSRRFVKSFPMFSAGFGIEPEISVHALEQRMPMAETGTIYAARPEGSVSKLNTYSDGFKVLFTMIGLYRAERPLQFFGIIAGLLAAGALTLVAPLAVYYAQTGLVLRLPTAILSSAMMIVAVIAMFAGLILDNVARGRRELKRLIYLQLPTPPGA